MKMYNLNVNLAATAATAATNLLAESACNTPRTPEILNSLIAMTNPLDNYNFGGDAPSSKRFGATAGGFPNSISSDSNSSTSSQVTSPTAGNPPSIQQTCSELIKAGLKLTIEQKRKHQNDSEDLLDLDQIKRFKKTESESEEDKIKTEHGLTPEDEERRRRRRERNKIAATKCRLKKRERTANLVHESETLETQNIDLKNQLQELQTQKRTLMDMLNNHRPHCPHNIGPATKDSLYRLPPVSSVMETHTYSRPATTGETSFRNHNLEVYSRPGSVSSPSNNMTYNSSRTSVQYAKPPSIVVEEIGDYENHHHFTNLDATTPYSTYNSQCHEYSSQYTNSGLDNGCMA